MNLREEDWSKNQDTIEELTARVQELQNEVNCLNDSSDFKDAESVRSGLSHVPSQPALLPPFRDPGGMLSRKDKPPDIWDTHGISGNVFLNSPASSSSPHPGGFNPWIPNVTEDTLVLTNTGRPVTRGERQIPNTVLTPRFQTGPSAGNSFDPKDGRFSKDYGADQQRLQIWDLHFDKFATKTTFACWKIRFKTEVCTCSQFPSEAMLWIKEVVMVESVDDLESSRSIRGTHGPNFELLDARIASALNKIIQNTRFKKKVSLEEMKAQKEDRFLRGRQIAYLIFQYFQVTGAKWFCRELCGPIHSSSSKWWYSGIRFKVGRNSTVDDEHPTWWHLGRIVQIKNTRVWETEDRIGIVQYGDSEKFWTWLLQIEDNGKKKYRAEFANEEFWGQKRKLWNKRRGQESKGKTAWTKQSGRLLAMESWRAVFERRQLRFPTRYK